ncbi:hypothetical protein V6N13_102752 [Hibiscus sabdariffa]|uniref:Uncharacterized protein n=1 Tax=Hibiscus sabdariffa TaxID=183260 RepID=A0ABR2D520_9ROSI
MVVFFLAVIRGPFHQRKPACKAIPFSIKCEQSTQKGSSLDVWLGRLTMNFGLTSPLPTVALAVTALVGVLTAIFIIQSAS